MTQIQCDPSLDRPAVVLIGTTEGRAQLCSPHQYIKIATFIHFKPSRFTRSNHLKGRLSVLEVLESSRQYPFWDCPHISADRRECPVLTLSRLPRAVAPHDDHLRSPLIVLLCSRRPRAAPRPANSFSHSTNMDGASPPLPPPPPQSLSLIASILTAAALTANASAVVGASPAAIEDLNVAAAAALGTVRGAVQDGPPPVPAAASGPPAASKPAAAAFAAPAVPAVAAPAAPSTQRRDR